MKKTILKTIFIAIDITVLVALFYLTSEIRGDINNLYIPKFNIISLENFIFVIFITIAFMYYENIYTLQFDFWQETYKIIKSLFLSYLIVLALITLLKTSMMYSRLFITLYFALGMLIVPTTKRLLKRFIYSFSFFKKKVLIVGDKKQVDMFKKEFKDNWYLGIKVDDKDYDTVFISSRGMSIDKVNQEITKYLDDKSSVYIVPYVTSINFANSNILEYSNIRHNAIQIQNKLLIKRNIYIKYLFDIVTILLFMPLLIIIHLLIVIAIRLDSEGPIFYRQIRLGKDGKEFVCYKYRTMYENSNKLLERYLKQNPDEVAYYKEFHKYKNDPRITRIGKFLRETSLDELAQVINVLKLEMSLIGPRPYMLEESCRLGNSKDFILKVKPGITGLWQVSGRNNLTFKERIELEVWYIKNWSLWADFVILIKTIKIVISRYGAK